VKSTKRLKVRGLYLVGLCLFSVFALGGAVGSASAAPLLFVPHSGKFPFHFAGSSGTSRLVTLAGTEISSPKSDVLVLVKNATLFNASIRFLEVKLGTEPCGAPLATSPEIAVNIEGHLGLTHPSDLPAALLLINGHVSFKCRLLGFEIPVLVKGSVIGRITSPAVGASSTLLLLSFKQTNGEQEFTSFLLGDELLVNKFEESSSNNGPFEKSAQEGHATLHALPGEGTFLLVSP
jgi:hypothetical protein